MLKNMGTHSRGKFSQCCRVSSASQQCQPALLDRTPPVPQALWGQWSSRELMLFCKSYTYDNFTSVDGYGGGCAVCCCPSSRPGEALCVPKPLQSLWCRTLSLPSHWGCCPSWARALRAEEHPKRQPLRSYRNPPFQSAVLPARTHCTPGHPHAEPWGVLQRYVHLPFFQLPAAAIRPGACHSVSIWRWPGAARAFLCRRSPFLSIASAQYGVMRKGQPNHLPDSTFLLLYSSCSPSLDDILA